LLRNEEAKLDRLMGRINLPEVIMGNRLYRISIWIVGVSFLASWALPRQSIAQASTTQPETDANKAALLESARTLDNEGCRLYGLHDYDGALTKFRGAIAAERAFLGKTDNADVVSDGINVAICQLALHRTASALQSYQQSLAMQSRICRGVDNSVLATCLNGTGYCLGLLNRWPEAKPKYEQALQMRLRMAQGKDAADVADSLMNLGGCLDNLGRPTDALPLFVHALAMRQNLSGGKPNSGMLQGLKDVAHCQLELHDWDDAQGTFQKVIAARRIVVGKTVDEELLQDWSRIADCLISLNRWQDALQACDAALKVCRQLSSGDSREMAEQLNKYAVCLKNLDREDDAIDKFKESFDIRWNLAGNNNDPGLVTGLNNYGAWLCSLGRTAIALPEFQKALTMQEQLSHGKDDPDLAVCLNNVAHCLDVLGSREDALKSYQQAMEIQQRLSDGKDNRELAASLNNIGYCLTALKRPYEALPDFEKALHMWQGLAGQKDDPDVAVCLNNVAYCQMLLLWPRSALQYYIDALAMQRSLCRGKDNPGLAAGYNNLAACQDLLGLTDDAVRNYRQALSMSMRLRDPNAFRCASDLGWMQLNQHRLEDSIQSFEIAIDQLEQARQTLGGTDQDRMQFFATAENEFNPYRGMVAAQLSSGQPQRAMEYLDRGRSRSLMDMLERGNLLQNGDVLGPARQKAQLAGDHVLLEEIEQAHSNFAQARDNVAQAQSALEELVSDAATDAQISHAKQEMDIAEEQFVSRQRDVYNLAENHGAEDIQPLTADKIQAILSPGEWMLVYNVSSVGANLFLIGPRDQPIQNQTLYWPNRDAVDAATLEKKVTDYLSCIMRKTAARGYAINKNNGDAAAPASADDDPGYELFQSLMPYGVWNKIRNAKCVYVVPDGALDLLPLEALPTTPLESGQAAIERTYWLDAGPPLAYGPSATVLVNRRKAHEEQMARFKAGHGPTSLAVLLGDPIFRGDESISLWPLPGTKAEINAIYQSLFQRPGRSGDNANAPAIKELLGEDATVGELFQAAAGARYVHLATHGLMECGDRAIFSELALTQPQVPSIQDDGFLTLADLFDHWGRRLSDTQLVVLSACQSAGDSRDRSTGEGVFGLPWGFMYAGTPAVIASLWDVDDKSTGQMMGHLYEQLQNQTPLNAFVGVRKDLRKHYPEPFYWAPFIYIGCPE
jgi:tetratricopeptide (TPR) repeat protein